MAYDIRIWEHPIAGEPYAIGGDPAEGLEHGDDSVLEVVRCTSGHQVAEVQGKIEPLAFAEMAFALGTYYNMALIGIENNKDGGANRHLFSLGYRNIFFEQADRGKPYDEATAKLGIFMSAPLKARLVAWMRRAMMEGDLVPHSDRLIAQFEIFVLDGVSFQAISGGHDDLVMAWLIAGEMMRMQIAYEEARQNKLVPLVNGRPIDEVPETTPIRRARSQAIIERVRKEQHQPDNISTVGALV